MKVLFLKVDELKEAKYLRKGKKNLLKTKLGTGDTIALSGKLIKVEKTDYGPRLWIDDGKKIGIVVGTFNKKVRKDAQKILEKFDNKEKYLLAYGNPYYKDKLYINVNQDNGVILVTKEVYQKFHQLRKKSQEYLRERKKLPQEGKKVAKASEIGYKDIFNFIKRKGGKAKIEEIEKYFSSIEGEVLDKKLLELLESGLAYEPEAGLIELI